MLELKINLQKKKKKKLTKEQKGSESCQRQSNPVGFSTAELGRTRGKQAWFF